MELDYRIAANSHLSLAEIECLPQTEKLLLAGYRLPAEKTQKKNAIPDMKTFAMRQMSMFQGKR